MSGSDETGDITVNSATSFVVAVPYQGPSGPEPGKYAQVLRMGAPDPSLEGTVVDASGNAITVPSDVSGTSGVAMYSADQVAVHTPQLTIAAQDQVSATLNDNGAVVQFSTSDRSGAAAEYLLGRSVGVAVGSTTSLSMGSALSSSIGTTASVNAGLQFSSLAGASLSVFDGVSLAISADDITLEGLAGAVVWAGASGTVADNSISLAVAPPAALANPLTQVKVGWSKKVAVFTRLLEVVTLTFTALVNLVVIAFGRQGNETSKLTNIAASFTMISATMHMLAVLLQVCGLFYAMMLSRHYKLLLANGAGGRLMLDAGRAELSFGAEKASMPAAAIPAGPPVLTTGVRADQNGLTVAGKDIAVTATNSVTIKFDPPAPVAAGAIPPPPPIVPTVTINSDSIVLSVGMAELRVAKSGVTAKSGAGLNVNVAV